MSHWLRFIAGVLIATAALCASGRAQDAPVSAVFTIQPMAALRAFPQDDIGTVVAGLRFDPSALSVEKTELQLFNEVRSLAFANDNQSTFARRTGGLRERWSVFDFSRVEAYL